MDFKDISIYKHDPETDGDTEIAKFSPRQLAKEFDNKDLGNLLSEFLNLGGKDISDGYALGHYLRSDHRTLQRLVICFALGLICGLSEQEYTDARNATAVATAKKIKQMIDDGQLPVGMYI